MKFKPAVILFVFALALSVFGQTSAGGFVSGKLLRSNGRPLPFTEIELVPVAYNKQIDDKRFWAISNGAGNFSFSDVPGGKYTLSINFDEKPTDTSPYPTYFYPSNINRAEAETIEVTTGRKITGLTFRVPPPLAQRKVTGKVVDKNGKPVEGAFVYLRDVKYDESLVLDIKTDKNGNFTLVGFETRKYQVGALLYEVINQSVLDLTGKVLASAYSPVFTLAPTNPHFTLVLEDSDEIKNSKEKNIGMLIFK